VSGYLRLWAELLGRSWRRSPGLTAGIFLVNLVELAATAGIALALRTVVDATVHGVAGTALAGACGAAVGYGIAAACGGLAWNMPGQLGDKVFVQDLHPQVYGWIAEVEGLEHLERSDFLDQVELVRRHTWRLSMSLWRAVAVLFSVLQLGVVLLLLGTVTPWLLVLLLFAALPLWFDHRGKQAVVTAETDTAEAFRLQRHLFALGTAAASGKDIRVAGAGEELARRQAEAWDTMTGVRYRARVRAAWWKFGGWAVFACGFAAGLGLVAYRVAQGHGTAGDLVLAVTVSSGLRQTMQRTVGNATDALAARTYMDPYLWLRDYVAADRARTAGTAQPPQRLLLGIVFEGVGYRYPGTERLAVRDLDLRIPAGTVVAIVGEYGSGKTTLVKLLGKFYRPDVGRITLDGVDLAELDTEAWRLRTSAAFQDFGRLETVFAEGVGLGDLEHLQDRDRIRRAVRDADAETLVQRLPQGLDSRLGRELGGVELSEGQWQRVALARAVMRDDPLLFVLDEPTASLDAPSEHAIFERQMARARELAARTGAITVIVSHRFSTVTGADLILVLDDGRLVESGTHAQLSAIEGGRYADLYGIQSAAYGSGAGESSGVGRGSGAASAGGPTRPAQ
jgi:ATP-binding cassette subfamily B protein